MAATADQMRNAVHAYVDGINGRSLDGIVNIFAEDASVEDPVGSVPVRGRAAITDFYRAALDLDLTLSLQGPIRLAAGHAAFPFQIAMAWRGEPVTIDVIDIFTFDDAGKVTSMKAIFSRNNRKGRGK